MPHLSAAFNYARWLTRSEVEAEDVVQEACVRAMRFFSSLRDGDARPWLLAIVRNTWYTHAGKTARIVPLGDEAEERRDPAPDPEQRLVRRDDIARVRTAIEQLPPEFREVVLLREIEGLSYKEIAEVIRAPIGTVMSRLSRGRERLLATLVTEVAR